MTEPLIDIRLGDWREVLSDVGECDAVITDPPYGARTHAGHDASANGHLETGKDNADRQTIGYRPWAPSDVADFVSWTTSACSGWVVAMTSHDLAPYWMNSLEAHGRYVFAPLPFVAPGSRCRLSGDGPSSWSVWIIVARPKNREFATWGTLPGAYVGAMGKLEILGGKPEWLMRAIIRDYTKPGDLIVDPFAGSGTTLIAARAEGRNCVGAEIDPETYERAGARIAGPHTGELFA